MRTDTYVPSMLVELDDDEFAALVDLDLRRRLDASTKRALRDPDVVERFYGHLVAIGRKVEGDLAFRRAECEALDETAKAAERATYYDDEARARAVAEAWETARDGWLAYDQWRPGTIRFKSGLDSVLAQVKPLRDEALRRKIDPDVFEQLRRRVVLLEGAISRHHDETPVNAELANMNLWATIG